MRPSRREFVKYVTASGIALSLSRLRIAQTAEFPARATLPRRQNWHLAPRSMAWEGKTLAEICAQIKDPARNGGRKPEDLIHHIGEDTLVGWAWAPGYGRSAAPGTQKIAGALVEASG